jgi:hypothetical protein
MEGIKKIKERKVMKFNPTLKYAIEAEQDHKFAESERTRRTSENIEGEPPYRFTFGKLGDNFSGAITIKSSEVLPKMFILVFNPTNESYDIEIIKEEIENGRLHESGEGCDPVDLE